MCICEELFRLVLDAIQKKIQNNIGFNKRSYLSYMETLSIFSHILA